MTSTPMHKAFVEISKFFLPPSTESILICSQVLSCSLQCPGHAALHTLEGARQPPYNPNISHQFHALSSPQEITKGRNVRVRCRHQGHSSVVVPTEDQGVLCRENQFTGMTTGFLTQCLWGQFLMASTLSLRTIFKGVRSQQDSYLKLPSTAIS